jgi:prepilin-type N-terminal cleavage/methylation domain-containing protein
MAKSSPPHVRRAFTLIELLVVIAGIGILLGIAIPSLNWAYERAKVTKDLSNLRQIGAATQMYMNDNNGVVFSTGAGAGFWMTQLHPKYLPAWNIFQSPLDKRPGSEVDANAKISYGINGNGVLGISADRIMKPTELILFAPAQDNSTSVHFAGDTSANVTVYKDASVPGGTAPGGTHASRARINALFGDLHVENMPWTVFIDETNPSPNYRWNPGGFTPP